MNENHGGKTSDQSKTPVVSSTDAMDRRDFVGAISYVAMAGGLIGGYGALAAMAGRYLYQETDDTAWLFVAQAETIKPGESLPFESPVGVRVVVTRKSTASASGTATDDQFLALSSVCPHLGCRVHWESQNNRFFCPCHNGTFDPLGKATGGPPLAAGQSLPEYPLKVEHGSLFIKLPIRSVGVPNRRRNDVVACDDAEHSATDSIATRGEV
jgi:Rieske Fe-S protein